MPAALANQAVSGARAFVATPPPRGRLRGVGKQNSVGGASSNAPQVSRRAWLAQGVVLGASLGCPRPPDPRNPPQPPKPPNPPEPPEPPGRPTRRNIATLANGDATLVAFREAVRQMKALPDSDRRSWRNQALIHQNFCPHGNWLFLPWHRAYLHFFEEICKELTHDERFALPYWNWTLNTSIPEVFWDAPANPLFHPGRVATPASQTGAPTDAPTLNGILDETNFQLFGSGSIALEASQRDFSFYGPLEGTPHNYVHGFVGGDMGSFMSPLDPIFWCHHNMIEALWFEWNVRRSNPNPSEAAWADRVFTEFCDRRGLPVRVSVKETLLYPAEAYHVSARTAVTTTNERRMVLLLSGSKGLQRDRIDSMKTGPASGRIPS